MNNEITLTGNDLTTEQVVQIASDGVKVKIETDAKIRVLKSHNLLIEAACQGFDIYGFTNSVGAKKNIKVLNGYNCKWGSEDTLSDEAIKYSKEFNKRILLSHNVNVGEELDEEVVRAMMVARLNTMIKGLTGANPDVIEMFKDFLNIGIHPVAYSKGSTGMSDITVLPTIGLAMTGSEDIEVYYCGKRMSAKKALNEACLKPIEPFAKDALSILSSNSYSAGIASITLHKMEHLMDMADIVFALSLEGLNGNIVPLIKEVQEIRPFKGQNDAAKKIITYLKGSYLWDEIITTDEEKYKYKIRSLQDPLSFRDVSQVHGSVCGIMGTIRKKIKIQLNSSDDNPAVLVNVFPDKDFASTQIAKYVVMGNSKGNKVPKGMIVPTANYDPLYWVLDFEALGIALSHLSKISIARIFNFGSPAVTNLNKFLAPDSESYGFGILQNTCLSIYTEIRNLSNPSSVDFLDVAGNIEDDATNAPFVIHQIDSIINNLYYLLGIELFNAAQAVDLRTKCANEQQDFGFVKLGVLTDALHKTYRKEVPYVDKDRSYNIDIIKSHKFLKAYSI